MALLTRERLVAIVVLLTASAAPRARPGRGGGHGDVRFRPARVVGHEVLHFARLLTSMGVPERRPRARSTSGSRARYVPQMSDEERRIGFNGTKLAGRQQDELLRPDPGQRGARPGHRARARLHAARRGRGRQAAPLGARARPAVPALGQLAPRRARLRSDRQDRGRHHLQRRRGGRGYDAAAEPVPVLEPSKDESHQKVIGLELVAGYDGRSRFKPYPASASTTWTSSSRSTRSTPTGSSRTTASSSRAGRRCRPRRG